MLPLSFGRRPLRARRMEFLKRQRPRSYLERGRCHRHTESYGLS
jgi:hypothetical protein